MTPAHQQVCDFLYLNSPVQVKGTVTDKVPGKPLNILDLQIIYLCIAQPKFDWSAIAFRMQLVKENAQPWMPSHAAVRKTSWCQLSPCVWKFVYSSGLLWRRVRLILNNYYAHKITWSVTIKFYYFFCSTDSFEILFWIVFLSLQNF